MGAYASTRRLHLLRQTVIINRQQLAARHFGNNVDDDFDKTLNKINAYCIMWHIDFLVCITQINVYFMW